MYTKRSFFALCVVLLGTATATDYETQAKNGSLKVLSRRKRYLVFPEGSSLQLVFCLTVPSVGMGRIFTLGGTAALAWELPHDPFVPFKKPAELLHRRKDTKVGGWSSSKVKMTGYGQRGKLTPTKLTPVSYAHPAKTDIRTVFYNWHPPQISYRRDPVASYKPPVTTYLHPVYHEVHRRTRRELYGKLEKFFRAQNKDGKACLLKAICEVSQASKGVGSFMEEILKTIFRVKPHDDYPDEDEYDLAAKEDLDCYERYSTCDFSIWDLVQ